MNLIKFLFWVTILLAVILNSISIVDFSLLLLSTLLSMAILTRYPLFPNAAKYMLLLIVWIAVVMMPSLHLISHISSYVNYQVVQVDYERVLSFGSKVFFITVFSFLICGRLIQKKNTKTYNYQPRVISERYVKTGFIIAFILSLFSLYTGISKLGGEPVYLPFHLGGIINLTKSILIPSLFAVFIENRILNKIKVDRKYFVLYGLWVLLEIFVCMSKGVILNYSLPLALVLIFYYRPSPKLFIRYLAPIVLLFLFLYPIIGVMRYDDSGSFTEKFLNSKKQADEVSEDKPFVLITVMNRVFMTGFQYSVDYQYLDKEQFFDFSRLPLLFIYRGSAGYQTHYADGYPDDAINSSGTTGIMDPLLHGGYGLCYIVITFIMLLAGLTDKFFRKRQYSIYSLMLLLIWGLCNSNISSLYDPVGLQQYLVSFISMYLAYIVNFKHSVKSLNNQ